MMTTFADLVTSRKTWIAEVLKPWCQQAALKDLRQADDEWADIAGRVDSAATLWTWAWSRFPDLVYEGLNGINETHEVRLTLNDGTAVVGYPTSKDQKPGELIVIGAALDDGTSGELGPFTIDAITSAQRLG